MIFENLENIRDDIIEMTEDMLEDRDVSSNDPMMVSWSYESNPEITYTLLIQDSLPEVIDYLTSETVH